MLQLAKVQAALKAVEDCCGHCEYCSPDCPIFIARRALRGLAGDLRDYMEGQGELAQDNMGGSA